jgi:hypothetical protein
MVPQAERLAENWEAATSCASDFEALSTAMRRQPHNVILYAFDLLHLDGKDLRQQTLVERRASLKTLLGIDERSRVQFSDEFVGDGDALFKACAERYGGFANRVLWPILHYRNSIACVTRHGTGLFLAGVRLD